MVYLWTLLSIVTASILNVSCVCSIKTAGREILNQRLCCMHPNIIQFQEVFLTPDHLAIVSEYAPGGDLVDFIERHNSAHDRALRESEARRLFQQLIVGVDFCHQVCMLCLLVYTFMLHNLHATFTGLHVHARRPLRQMPFMTSVLHTGSMSLTVWNLTLRRHVALHQSPDCS